jgi:UDP-glucose 4-epimerase
VNDLAEAHVLALQNIAKAGRSQVLNLGTGAGHSVREVLAMVKKVTGKAVPYRVVPRRAGDPPALVADASRARDVLGWTPQRDLQAMVLTASKWMASRRVPASVESETPRRIA